MLIAVMSDSHDNIWNVRKALRLMQEHEAGMIIHCGDLVAPFTLKELTQLGKPVHWVLGNNDGDPYMLTKISLAELQDVKPYGFIGKVNVEEVSIGFTHYEEVGWALAHTGEYDLVCCGHTHVRRVENIHDTVLLNPGDVMGKDGLGSFCLFDTKKRDITVLSLE